MIKHRKETKVRSTVIFVEINMKNEPEVQSTETLGALAPQYSTLWQTHTHKSTSILFSVLFTETH